MVTLKTNLFDFSAENIAQFQPVSVDFRRNNVRKNKIYVGSHESPNRSSRDDQHGDRDARPRSRAKKEQLTAESLAVDDCNPLQARQETGVVCILWWCGAVSLEAC